MGVFARILAGLAAEGIEIKTKTIMIDATYLKVHRTASSLRVKKGGPGRLIGRTKSGMNTKLHAITDAIGRPITFFMSAGQVSDYTSATALLSNLPAADWLICIRLIFAIVSTTSILKIAPDCSSGRLWTIAPL